jgi:hypothetical protein
MISGYAEMTLAEHAEARARPYEQLIVCHSDGGTEGRDPRRIPRDELATLHEPMPVLRAIRAKCGCQMYGDQLPALAVPHGNQSVARPAQRG